MLHPEIPEDPENVLKSWFLGYLFTIYRVMNLIENIKYNYFMLNPVGNIGWNKNYTVFILYYNW